MSHISCSKVIPAKAMQVYELLTDPEKLGELLSDDLEVEVVNAAHEFKVDAEYSFNMARWGLKQFLRFRIIQCKPGVQLSYKQVEGLFARWTHAIKLEEHGPEAVLLTDLVDYELPLGLFGHLADDLFFRSDLKNILEHRLSRVCQHFE